MNGVFIMTGREMLLKTFKGESVDRVPICPWINKFGWVRKGEEYEIAKEYVSALDIKVTSFEQSANTLSGGNQ